ncbi:MAG: hypothetical protein ACYCU6_14080 [Acidimicrobiales bacterium]
MNTGTPRSTFDVVTERDQRPKEADRPPEGGPHQLWLTKPLASGGVKAKPYGRPAAGLDTAARLNIATLNDVVISKVRVRQHHHEIQPNRNYTISPK